MLVGSNSRNPKPHAQDQLTLFSRYRFGFEKDIIWPPKISPLSYSDTFVFHSWFLGAFTSWQRNPFKFWVNNTIKKTWRINLIYGFFFQKKKHINVCVVILSTADFLTEFPAHFTAHENTATLLLFLTQIKITGKHFFFRKTRESVKSGLQHYLLVQFLYRLLWTKAFLEIFVMSCETKKARITNFSLSVHPKLGLLD